MVSSRTYKLFKGPPKPGATSLRRDNATTPCLRAAEGAESLPERAIRRNSRSCGAWACAA